MPRGLIYEQRDLRLARPFVPSRVPGCRLWTESRWLSLAADDPVGSMLDRSGQGNHPSQSVSAARPVYKTAIFGSQPGVLFDGVDDFLAADGVASILSGSNLPATVIICHKLAQVVSGYSLWSFGRTVLQAQRFHVQSLISGATIWRIIKNDNANTGPIQVDTSGALNTAPHVLSVVHTGFDTSAWRDGSSILASTSQGMGALTLNAFTLGCLRRQTNSQFANFYLGAAVVYNRALTSTERRQVEHYLADIYGVAVQ